MKGSTMFDEEPESNRCEVTGRGGFLIMITVIYLLLVGFDAVSLSDSLDKYQEAEDAYCEVQITDCKENFYAQGNEFAVTKNIAALRLSVIFINGIVLLFTWLNQCVVGATILSLPWSQLAFAYIIAIVWYIYFIGVPAFDDSQE